MKAIRQNRKTWPLINELLETLPDGVVILSVVRDENGTCCDILPTYMNRNARPWLGLEPDKSVGQSSLAGRIPDFDLSLVNSIMKLNRSVASVQFNEYTQCWMRASYSRLGELLMLRMEKVVTSQLHPRPVQPIFDTTPATVENSTVTWPCLTYWTHGMEGWWVQE